MDISNLSKEELAVLEAQLSAKKRTEREKEMQEREALKELTYEFVDAFFPKLIHITEILTLSKGEIFDGARDVLALKKSVYRMSDEAWEKQQAHPLFA